MRFRFVRLSVTAAIAALAAMVVAAPAWAAPADPGHVHAAGKHAAHSSGGSRTRNMTYHGGPVETAPAVYISWWGPEWAAGFSSNGYTSAQAQTYVHDFFSNVGGSSWDNIDTQYCSGVAVGTINCGSAGSHITNPAGQLKGEWNDLTTVPASPSQTDINNAAVRARQHFSGANLANSTFFVFTPSGKSQSGFAGGNGGSWCAYHSNVSTTFYAYMPYQPDAAGSCGENFINSNNSYGNGYFDGFSVVGGHEYAEAMTDPYTQSGHYAWYDSGGQENGDKCAWSSQSGNITLGSHFYAVQPIWSNISSGCAMSR